MNWQYGDVHLRRNELDLAKSNFIYSDSGRELGEIYAQSRDEKSVATGVLQQLCIGFFIQASQVLKIYITKLEIDEPSPTLNFLKMITECIEKSMTDAFFVLYEKYEPIWADIENGPQYMLKISETQFGVRVQADNPLSGMMDMVSSMFSPQNLTPRSEPLEPKKETSTGLSAPKSLPKDVKGVEIEGMADDDDLD